MEITISSIRINDLNKNELDVLQNVRLEAAYDCKRTSMDSLGYIYSDHRIEEYKKHHLSRFCKCLRAFHGNELLGYLIYWEFERVLEANFKNINEISDSFFSDLEFQSELYEVGFSAIYLSQIVVGINKKTQRRNGIGNQLLDKLKHLATEKEYDCIAGLIHCKNSYSMKFFRGKRYNFLAWAFDKERGSITWLKTIKLLKPANELLNKIKTKNEESLKYLVLLASEYYNEINPSKFYSSMWSGCGIDMSPFLYNRKHYFTLLSGFLDLNDGETVSSIHKYYSNRSNGLDESLIGKKFKKIKNNAEKPYVLLIKGENDANFEASFDVNSVMPLSRVYDLSTEDSSLCEKIADETGTLSSKWGNWVKTYKSLAINDIRCFNEQRSIVGGKKQNILWLHILLKMAEVPTEGVFFMSFSFSLDDSIKQNVERAFFHGEFVKSRLSAALLGIFRAELLKANIRTAISAIMSRNMSHNLGSHVVTNAKHQIEDLESRQGDGSVKMQLKGVSALLQYLQERQDFIATIANDEHYPNGPLNFKSTVFDVLAMDGPSYRHNIGRGGEGAPSVNNYILDNIVRSEGVARKFSLAGLERQRNGDDGLKIDLQLVRVEGSGRVVSYKSLSPREIGNEFSDFTLSVNNGLNGRQAFLSILENVIRNAAKHCKEDLQRLEDDTLLFSVVYRDTGDGSFEITVCDNKRNFSKVRRAFEEQGLLREGRLAPLHILREDGGGISRDNKGIKEILISLAWLKHGEILPSGEAVSYETLQSTPWQLLDVVGVDTGSYETWKVSALAGGAEGRAGGGVREGLSFGYQFRLAKYKEVHLLSERELKNESKSLTERLAELPGASLYAVRKSDWAQGQRNPLLRAIPRLEVVADGETEASLAKVANALLEANLKRRLGVESLPPVRITENVKRAHRDWDSRVVVRDAFGEEADRAFAARFAGPFIHYVTHYETVLNEARSEADLNLKPGAVFTEGISGGNYTNTLIRTDISQRTYHGIVEAALTSIAIVDERLFDKFKGNRRADGAGRGDAPQWHYLEQKRIHILNSREDAGGQLTIVDLWGRRTSLAGANARPYDFLSIHLGLIDKVASGTMGEREKLQRLLALFGPRYHPEWTKLAIHSGRGGLMQIENIAFISLSGIEWALDNCKYVLSEFFHGLKYPPIPDNIASEYGTRAGGLGAPYNESRRGGSAIPPALADSGKTAGAKSLFDKGRFAATQTPLRYDSLMKPAFRTNLPQVPRATPALANSGATVAAGRAMRHVFLFTTYAFAEHHLYSRATESVAPAGARSLLDLDEIAARGDCAVEKFHKIAHINSTFFFYPCVKSALLPPSRHDEFIQWLVEHILGTFSRNGDADVSLHLILHASDSPSRRRKNTKDVSDPLLAKIKRQFPIVAEAAIYWFAHDDTGIHKILCNRNFFENAQNGDKAEHLLRQLAYHTNTRIDTRIGVQENENSPTATAENRAGENAEANLSVPSSAPAATYPPPTGWPRLYINGFDINDKIYLDRLALWQLKGADDPAALKQIFSDGDDDAPFWKPEYAPERSNERIRNPHPLIVIGQELENFFSKGERRINYLDSSIWLRWAKDDKEAEEISRQFDRFAKLGLYECNAGREHLEFWARQLLMSRLGEFGSGTRGHSKIVPILFHSESEMRRIMEKKWLQKITETYASRPLKWKILLIDDHAKTNLSGGKSSKLDIICEALAPLFSITRHEADGTVVQHTSSQPTDGRLHIAFHYAQNMEEGMRMLGRQRFDIVFLDYLLNKPDEHCIAGEPDFVTADELLKFLSEPEMKNKRGPLERFWLFNVSAFSSAMESKLVAKGLAHHTADWEMNRGACPITTPELFKHNLLSFMVLQLDTLTQISAHATHEDDGRIVTLLDLLQAIYTPENGDVRKAAERYFHVLLKFKSDHKILRKDIEYGMEEGHGKSTPQSLKNNPCKSEIVYSLFPEIVHFDDAFWDHLMHLIYLTAHGAPLQWSKMLVNFKEIEGLLFSVNSDTAETKQRAKNLITAMENYICQLSSSGRS